MSFVQEFKDFAVKGNAIDMAVGIIIGAGFNKVVNSIVNDVFMPPIGMAIGGVDFKNLEISLQKAGVNDSGEPVAAVAVRYGMLLNTVIEFLIVAFSVFMVVKFMNRMLQKRPA